ncbi:MAG: M1 family metallopeptidase, partial [Planctomycetes bacterium]|nr:M1 family metallopeptidase [Planctomycetota bacterium]
MSNADSIRDFHLAGGFCRSACCAMRISDGAFSTPGTPLQYPPDLEIEPTHLDINLKLDLEKQGASGTVTTTVIGRRNGPTTLKLNAIEFHDVKVVDVDGNALTFAYDGDTITVHWKKAFKKGEERKLAVSYHVDRPASGLFFSKPDKEYPKLAWYVATDHETERARYWLPCIDLPNVRTTLEFRLTADKRFTILANGKLMGEKENKNGTKTAHWKLEQRCPSYLVCFAIGDFVRYDDGEFEGRPVAYFTSKEFTAADLKRSFGTTKKILAWMTKRLKMGFPFPKYYQFALPFWGGAMENISLVSWDDSFVLDETSALEWASLVDAINVHEMAHSYFGDAVVCRDYAHAWLKESWATYMETCWLEDEVSRDEQTYELYLKAHGYFAEADGVYARAIVTREFKSSWEMYDRHLYPGGACRLHTLRNELGDEVFWSAVSDYLHRYDGKVVETEDFRRVMEEHSGRSLVKFFDQWFYRPGYPNIKVTFEYDTKKKTGTFTVEQQQMKDDKDRPFELHTELGWTIGGKEHTQAITIDSKKHEFTIPMASDPEQVRFDPNWKVLHKLEFNPGDERLKRQLSGAKDVVGRILAAHELVKTGKRSNVEAVVAAYKKEKFWGARNQFIFALGHANHNTALEGLTDFIASEKDPMVMEHLFRAAGKYRDKGIAAALEKRLKGDLPYRAKMAALEALGHQGDDAPLAMLVKEAGKTDPYGTV